MCLSKGRTATAAAAAAKSVTKKYLKFITCKVKQFSAKLYVSVEIQ